MEFCEHSNEHSGLAQSMKSLNQLSNYQHFNKYPVSLELVSYTLGSDTQFSIPVEMQDFSELQRFRNKVDLAHITSLC